MATLYANENFTLSAVLALRDLNHDVLTSRESGKANQATPDDEVLAYATQSGRAVLTFNRRDFIKLHAADPNRAGIIVCTFNSDAEGLAARVHAAINDFDSLHGALIRVNRPST
jgi:predicted transcriptional regulator